MDGVHPEDGPGQLRAPGPDQAEEGNDLTSPHREADVVQHALTAEVLHPQHLRTAALLPVDRGERQIPPDHHADHRRDVGFLHGKRADLLPVAEHRHAVADPLHLLQAVRDVDHAHVLAPDALRLSAFAISIIWRCATLRSITRVRRSTRRPMRSSSRWARRYSSS